ncbi:MAG TPA: DUF3024 domain-containing protein [Desulfuromonadales bacterium]|nr:DUF3024 domain-containing protein [Desulfuromonadales bacterium]
MSALAQVPALVPELLRRRVESQLDAFCLRQRRRLACPQVRLQYAWENNGLQLMFRDGCNPPQPVARFTYSPELRQWSLLAPGLPQGWRLCMELPPTLNFERLLAYLEEDPLNLFWPASFSCFS